MHSDCGNGTKKRRKQEKRRNSGSSLRGRRSKGEGNQDARPRAPNFPLPLPLLTPATRATRGEARGAARMGGAEKERRACPPASNFCSFSDPCPRTPQLLCFPRLAERKQKRLRRLRDRYLNHEALDLTYIFSVFLWALPLSAYSCRSFSLLLRCFLCFCFVLTFLVPRRLYSARVMLWEEWPGDD